MDGAPGPVFMYLKIKRITVLDNRFNIIHNTQSLPSDKKLIKND